MFTKIFVFFNHYDDITPVVNITTERLKYNNNDNFDVEFTYDDADLICYFELNIDQFALIS